MADENDQTEDQKSEAPANETPKQKREREAAEAQAAADAEAARVAAEQEAARKAAPPVRHLKYAGSADSRVIPRGDTAGQTLSALPIDITFNRGNGWTVSTDQFPSVPQVWWDHLIDNEPGIIEVTEQVTDPEQAVPLNDHQRIFLGMVQRGEKKRTSEPGVGQMPVSSSERDPRPVPTA